MSGQVSTRVKSSRTIAQELYDYRNYTMRQLYYWDGKKYGCLSPGARQVLHDAAESIHGMVTGPNDYWLPDIMSEAIEAAEALGI
jgi:hypothetical protein